jgi:hypothetical protein
MRTRPPIQALRALVTLLAAAAALPAARGAPLQVRAHAALEVKPRLAADGGLAVAGLLADDRGRPIGAEVVQIRVTGCGEHTAQTGDDGTFAVRFAPTEIDACARRDGIVALAVYFGGSSRFGPATWSKSIDPRRALVDLVLQVTPQDVADGEPVALAVTLLVDGEPLPGAGVGFEVGERAVGEARTDARGEASLGWVPARGGGERGVLVVRARFAGTARLNAAHDERPLRIHGVPQLTAEPHVSGPDLVVAGRLAEPEGTPLAGAVLTLLLDGRATRSLVTDERGQIALRTPVRRLTDAPPGRRVWVALRFEPADPSWAPVRSDEVALVVPVPPTIPLPRYLWLLAAVVGTLLALGPGVAGVRRLRERLRGARPRRRRGPAVAPALPAAGLVPAPPDAGSPAPEDGRDVVRVRLWDVDAQAPIGAAPIALETAAGRRHVRETDALGWVSFPPAAPGAARLVADLPRFEPHAADVLLPHDGSLDGATLQLVSCRLAGLVDWRRYLAQRFAGGDGWGRHTPRQVLAALRDAGGAGPRGATAAASGLVADSAVERFEQLYYGDPPAPRPALSELRRALGAPPDAPSRERTELRAALPWLLAAAALLSGAPDAAAQAARTAPAAPGQPPGPAAERDYDPSATGWNGLGYLAHTADEAHVGLALRDHVDWRAVSRDDVLFLLYPLAPPLPRDVRAFLEDGGDLVVADDFGRGDGLFALAGLERVPAPATHAPRLADHPRFPEFPLGPPEEHFLFFHADRLVANHPAALVIRDPRRCRPIVRYATPDAPALVAECTVGEGRLLAIADASLFINEMLRGVHGDKQFAANVLRYFCGPSDCAVTLALPHAVWSGRYRTGPPPVTDLDSFFRASVAALDGLLADANQALRALPIEPWLGLAAAAALALLLWRRGRVGARTDGAGFAGFRAERVPIVSAAEVRARTLARGRRADYSEPAALLRRRLQHALRVSPDEVGRAAIGEVLRRLEPLPDAPRVEGRRLRTLSAGEFLALYRDATRALGASPAGGRAPLRETVR